MMQVNKNQIGGEIAEFGFGDNKSSRHHLKIR